MVYVTSNDTNAWHTTIIGVVVLSLLILLSSSSFGQTAIAIKAGDKRYPGKQFFVNGFNVPITAAGGVLYDQYGIRLSYQIYNGVDENGRDVLRCEPMRPVSDNVQRWAANKIIRYWRIKFKLENNNIDKAVEFVNISPAHFRIENVDQPFVHGACYNVSGAFIDYYSGSHRLGPKSSLLIDDPSDGDWFFHRPSITSWHLSDFILKKVSPAKGKTPPLGGGAPSSKTNSPLPDSTKPSLVPKDDNKKYNSDKNYVNKEGAKDRGATKSSNYWTGSNLQSKTTDKTKNISGYWSGAGFKKEQLSKEKTVKKEEAKEAVVKKETTTVVKKEKPTQKKEDPCSPKDVILEKLYCKYCYDQGKSFVKTNVVKAQYAYFDFQGKQAIDVMLLLNGTVTKPHYIVHIIMPKGILSGGALTSDIIDEWGGGLDNSKSIIVKFQYRIVGGSGAISQWSNWGGHKRGRSEGTVSLQLQDDGSICGSFKVTVYEDGSATDNNKRSVISCDGFKATR